MGLGERAGGYKHRMAYTKVAFLEPTYTPLTQLLIQHMGTFGIAVVNPPHCLRKGTGVMRRSFRTKREAPYHQRSASFGDGLHLHAC